MTSPKVHKCQVLIVGGGPVGLVLACLLALNDIEVAVLERRTQPRQYSRAIGLHPPALAVLHEIGVETAALAEGTRVRTGTAYSRGRRIGSLSFEQAWPARPFVLTLPQNRTEAILRHRLERLAPGALQTGWEVTDIADRSGVHVTTRSTAEPSEAGPAPEARWRADLLIGTDGPHSLVRRTAGIGTRTRALKDTYVMGDFAQHAGQTATAEDSDETTAAIFLEPAGVVESFPLPGKMRRWVAHTGAELVPESAHLLSDLISERTGARVDPATATMVSAFHVRRRLAQRMVADRCVLVGDAAHEVSPIGGQGMTLGWIDALELAPLLSKALAAHDPAPLHQQADFQVFEHTRLAAARATARQAELNMALGRSMPISAAVIRDAALKTVLGTRMRHRLARAFTMRQPLGGAEIHLPR